jgi:predicted membrane protein
MEGTKTTIFLGIILISVGALLLLDNLNIIYFDFTDLIFSWQGLLLIIGAIILINHKESTAGLVIFTIGLVTFSARLFQYRLGPIISDYWPVILIVVGLYFIFKRSYGTQVKKNKFDTADESRPNDPDFSNYLDIDAVFSSPKKYITSSNFKGGRITAIFGGANIDLTQAELAEGQNTLEVTAIFGGIDLFLPRDWKVVVNVTSIFGGFDDGRRTGQKLDAKADRTLVVNGLAIFGGGEIKY